MPRLCPHQSPRFGVLSCSEGWLRLQEGVGLVSSSEDEGGELPEKIGEARGSVGACGDVGWATLFLWAS